VPTRYVVGFLVTERDSRTRAWIARNMDAHAGSKRGTIQEGRWGTSKATGAERRRRRGRRRTGGCLRRCDEVWLGAVFCMPCTSTGLIGPLSWLFTYHGDRSRCWRVRCSRSWRCGGVCRDAIEGRPGRVRHDMGATLRLPRCTMLARMDRGSRPSASRVR
jgi:hypothetical protein